MPDEKSQNPETHEKPRFRKNFALRESFHHDLSGCDLVMGVLKKPGKAEGPYVVTWMGAWQKTVPTDSTFATEEEARTFFNEQKEKAPPSTSVLARDWQRNAVYKWEDDAIGKGTPKLNEKQMLQVVRQLCKDFNIAALDLDYKEPRKNAEHSTSWYMDDKLVIRHRQFAVILHEITHAIDQKVNGNVWADHGPSFVRTLIALAAKYHWSDPELLEQSAKEAGILVAPAASVPALKALP